MPVPQEGPAEHIRNALAVFIARKQMAESLWEFMRDDADAPANMDEHSPVIAMSMDDANAIIERLKQALATL